MADDLTRLAQTILDLDKGVDAKRAELARAQGAVLEAERTRDALGDVVTKRTAEKATLEKAVAELTRDRTVLTDAKAQLTDEVAKLTLERDTLASELTALRQRVGIPAGA